MEIHNFPNGVKVKNLTALATPKSYFYAKNVARVSFGADALFSVIDTLRYQPTIEFGRTDITAIFDNGLAVPLPGTDELLYDLLCTYFFSALTFTVDPSKKVTTITGAGFNALAANNGTMFLFDLPTAIKTFTIPAGLPVGWNCEVVKMYAGNTITINGSGGMVVSGIDLILNNQYARVQIVVTGPATALVFNLGG